MPPFYDLECGNCNYEKDDVYFKSQEAFEQADKECPECGDTLEKKLPKINITGSSKSKQKPTITVVPPISISFGITEAPCGKKMLYSDNLYVLPNKKPKGLPKVDHMN